MVLRAEAPVRIRKSQLAWFWSYIANRDTNTNSSTHIPRLTPMHPETDIHPYPHTYRHPSVHVHTLKRDVLLAHQFRDIFFKLLLLKEMRNEPKPRISQRSLVVQEGWIYSVSSSSCPFPNRFYIHPVRKCTPSSWKGWVFKRVIKCSWEIVAEISGEEATWGVYPRILSTLHRDTFIPVNRWRDFFLCILAHFQHRSSSNALGCLESDWAIGSPGGSD